MLSLRSIAGTLCSLCRFSQCAGVAPLNHRNGRQSAWKRGAGLAALVGLYAMAVGMGGFKALQNTGMMLLLLGSAPFLPDMMRRLRREPVTWLVLAFLVFLLIRTLAASWAPDVEAVDHWDRAYRMSRVILILPVAWWLGGRQQRIDWMWICVIAGLVAAMVESWFQWGSVTPMFSGSRTEFRLNEQWMGMMCGIAAIGLVNYRRPLFAAMKGPHQWWPMALVWLSALLLMLQGFIVSQSRGAYIAVLIVATGLGLFAIRRRRRTVSTEEAWAPAVAVAILVVVLLATQWDTLIRRFDAEADVVAQILSGNWEDLQATPIGIRAYLLVAGAKAWLAAPWLGWGTDGAVQVILAAEGPDALEQFNHLHNTYLDLLVRFGLLGTILFLAIPFQLVRATRRALATGRVDERPARFLLSALSVFALANLTESYLVPSYGWFLFVILGGAMLTYRLWTDDSDISSREASGKARMQEFQ